MLSRAELGLEAPLVQVEVHLANGLPAFTIVGLPAPVVRESRERVRAALLNSGFQFPARRITVNLAPVELSKQGGRYDLPIALGLLMAGGQLAAAVSPAVECYGELGLGGELRPVAGLFLAALHAARAGHALIVPAASAAEVALSAHPAAYAVPDLRAAAQVLRANHDDGIPAMGPLRRIRAPATAADSLAAERREGLEEVVGQWQAKRALTIAAAGGHSVMLIGPPGSGKSLLATRLPGLLPPLSDGEALEVAGVRSLAGQRLEPEHWRERPFRSPHHTSSAHALVGGGPGLRPGEISLAHHGVLFLDELPEFDRRVLEALREPLESGSITIARAAARVQLPARFQLIAAMNPCPCGYLGDRRETCRCSPTRIERYRQRVSGPLLDRIDLRITVARLAPAELAAAAGAGLPSVTLDADSGNEAARAMAARVRRLQRSGALCAHLSAAQLRRCGALPGPTAALLRRSCQRLALSGRGVLRVLAVSRTIADLADSDLIEPAHLAEAIQLRRPFAPSYCPTSESM